MTAMLEVKDIHCAYDQVSVIHGISLHVNEGEIVAILGANGAGKSTVIDALQIVLADGRAGAQVTYVEKGWTANGGKSSEKDGQF